MKIGGFEVGKYVIKERAKKKHLIFDCRDCVYSASLADDRACRYHVLYALRELEADLIVLAEVYERVYNEEQTKLLKEIASLIQKLETESVWSYSHLGDPSVEGEEKFGERHDVIVRIAHDLLAYDPITAYLTCLSEVKKEKERIAALMKRAAPHAEIYLKNLQAIQKAFEQTSLISQTKRLLKTLTKVPDPKELYRTFFEAEVKPSFIGTRLLFGEEEKLELLDEYAIGEASVQIFEHPAKPQRLYFINTPEYTLPPDKYFILSKAREIVATYRPGKVSLATVARSRKYFERIYESSIRDIAKKNKITLSGDEVKELSKIVARYTVGYGILEILLGDRNLTDIYLDSPIGQRPLYVVHKDFGQCETNILYSPEEAEALVSKMRAMSGRPFDEAHPVLDFDIPEVETRVAVIGPPLAPDGVAFAFRLHKITPWTLPQFIDVKMFNPLAAGLLTFFIQNQATMLICGSRGSGKTSLLGACLLEILQNTRVIVQEDSVTGDTSIVAERNGLMERTTVGQLVDGLIERHGCENINGREILYANPEAVRVFSLNKQGKTELSKVTQFIRHKVSKNLYEVRTRTGKTIKVTEDHCLFGLRDNEIVPVASKELRKGSFIATPRSLPFSESHLPCFNLLEYLDCLEEGYLSGQPLQEIFAQNYSLLKKIAFSLNYHKSTLQHWKRASLLPVQVLKALLAKTELSLAPEELYFKADKKSKAIPVLIALDEVFLNFVGLWLAEGCYDGKYGVIVSAPDCRETIEEVAGRFGLRLRKHSVSLMFSNTAVNLVLREVLGLKGSSFTKHFPQWVFNLSKQQIAWLLKGLFSGNGYNAKYEVGISLASPHLIKDLQFLLLLFGIVGRMHPVKRDKTQSCRISSLKMVKLFAENIGFLQDYKQQQLQEICSRSVTHDNTDIIPFSVELKQQLSNVFSSFNRCDYVSRNFSLGREKFKQYLGAAATASQQDEFLEKLRVLAFADVFWDEVASIKCLGKVDDFVYDFSVPENENFVCENIVAHNTLEIPVPYIKSLGFNVQRMKTRSPIAIAKAEAEVAPEEALRTALRLGESALILGEVRSMEAKVLYEAMRIGAAGNVVMGTIHADSAYAVWDRVVNDLGVPSTSFKATDLIAVARPIRFGGSLKSNRRLIQLTEVKKHWLHDPEAEGGLLDLMTYDARKDDLELLEDNLKESYLFDKISRLSGLTYKEMWAQIRMLADSKSFLVEMKNKYKIPLLLEGINTVAANNKLLLLKEKQLEEFGEVDAPTLLGEWKNWVKNRLVKKLVKEVPKKKKK